VRPVLISISALLFGVGLLLLGNGLLGTLIGIRLAIGEMPVLATGAIMAGYFAGLLAGSIYAGALIARAGHIRAFSAFASVFSAATLAHVLFESPIVWGMLRLVEGFCMAGLFMCIESWLNARADNETRGAVLSIYMCVVYAAQGLGQFLLNLAAPAQATLFILASILLSLALVPVALTRSPQPKQPDPSPFGLRALIAISPLGVAGALVSGIALGSLYGLAPAFAHAVGLDVAGTARFVGAFILGGLILQWPLGRLSDRMDRRWVIAGVAATLALLSAATLFSTGENRIALWPLAIGIGGTAFTLYPLSVAHANDWIGPEDMVPASGGLLLAYGAGATAGPLVSSLVMWRLGATGLFVVTGAAALTVAAYSLYRVTRRPPVAETEQEPFRPLPRTTPAVMELDPRGPDELREGDTP
jgi:MFS family permease